MRVLNARTPPSPRGPWRERLPALRAAVWSGAIAAALVITACSPPPVEPLKLDGNMLTVDNRSDVEWKNVEIWLNTYYRVKTDSIPAKGRFQAPLDAFVAGFGQRFEFRRMQVKDLRLNATSPDGKPVEIKKQFTVGGLEVLKKTS
jgi:hypothetical protein